MNGKDILKKRKELNLTQMQLAEMLGLSYKTIQNYESGGTIPKSKYPILRSFMDEKVATVAEDQAVYMRKDTESTDFEKKMLIESINRMTETADRNSKTLEKIVDYLVSNGTSSIELPEAVKKGVSENKEGHTDNRSYKKSAG